MSEAVVGLIGVVLGAGLAGASEHLARTRTVLADSRAAARLLRNQLELALESLPVNVSEMTGSYDFKDALEEWNAQRASLARSLTYGEWEAVSAAMEFLYGFDGCERGHV